MTATVQVQIPNLTVGVADAAVMLGVSQDHIRNLIYKTKELPASRLGNRLLIKTSDLEELLVRNRI